MAEIRFTKMHGCGNDFIFIDCREREIEGLGQIARRLCDRRFGIGADQLLTIHPSMRADFKIEIYNADGSRGEMCGNGIRCVGKYVYDHGILRKDTLRVATDAGIKVLRLHVGDGRVQAVTVDMGEPVLDGPRIPVAAEGQVINAPLQVDGQTYRVTCVSMGNPHCVTFVPSVDGLPLPEIGPRFEYHPFFPKGVNTEFVQVVGPNELRMRVWERGSGETAACGTGACAVLVAAALNGKADRHATVHLNGGDLQIEWSAADNRVFMTGPAEEVFTGEIEV